MFISNVTSKYLSILIVLLLTLTAGASEEVTSISSLTATTTQGAKPKFVYAKNNGKQSSLKAKLITIKNFQKLYPEPDEASRDEGVSIGPFSVFHQLKTPDDKDEKNGFYRAGDSKGKAIGWLRKAEVIVWKTRYVLYPQVNVNDGKFVVYETRKSVESKSTGEKATLDKPAAKKSLRLAFILEPPKEDLGDDTQYTVVVLDREADQSGGGIAAIQEHIADLAMQIVFVYEGTDALTWDIDGITLKKLLGDLMTDITEKFKSEGVAEMVRFGIVAFQDNSDHSQKKNPAPFDARVIQELTTDYEAFNRSALDLPAWEIGGDWSEDGLSGLNLAIEILDKDKYSSNHIIYFGMTSPHEHGKGGNHVVWGSPRQFRSKNPFSDMRDTADSGFIGHTSSGQTMRSTILNAKGAAALPLTSKTIHTIFGSTTYEQISPNAGKETIAAAVTFGRKLSSQMNSLNSEMQLATWLTGNVPDGYNPVALGSGGLKILDYMETTGRAPKVLKHLAQNELGNFPGYFDAAGPTASEYKRVADNLFKELNKMIVVLQAAKDGDLQEIEKLTNNNEGGDSAFTSGSFRTETQGQLAAILGEQQHFVGEAPVRDDDGYLVAHKQVLVGRGELEVFENKLSAMLALFQDKSDPNNRGNIKDLLNKLQTYAIETVTGEQIPLLADSELKAIITELPLQTSALDITAATLSEYDQEDFERWVESIKSSRKRCIDILSNATLWKALTDSAPQDMFAFIRVEDMP